ncbi:hypothetical protein Cni_G20002 [Canna indica]|uniref:Uncharacterized protein n=1 Tax=Canna indica TaxID=4628 RepID=A0AAQ3KNA2_9LILI|nr:hypothetical protein Cni_G20002 [Canna indica]
MKEFDHRDIYQQMEIVCYKGRFMAKLVASDGIPPSMLRKEYWDLHHSEHDDFTLVEASGVNEALCSRLPALYSPSTKAKNGGNVVEMSLSEQVKQSAYYEITLEQFWEQIGACESACGVERVAEVQSIVRVEAAYLNGKEAKCFDTHNVDELVWFKTINSEGGIESVVKLSYQVWERIKWEENRVGCNGGGDEKVERVEEYRGVDGWKRFGCCVGREVCVEEDGWLMVDFRHIKKVQRRRMRSEKNMAAGGRKKRREGEEEK